MKQDTKQEYSLEKSIEILAEMTRKDIEKSYNLESFSNVNAHYSGRYGWTLKKKNVLPPDKSNS